jgi:cytochrome c peroxidase
VARGGSRPDGVRWLAGAARPLVLAAVLLAVGPPGPGASAADAPAGSVRPAAGEATTAGTAASPERCGIREWPRPQRAEPPPAGDERRAVATGAALGLTPDEVTAILAHGPWPPPFTPDPTNRHSGDPIAIALGHRLFSDPRLSPDGSRSCASCHRPDRGFGDGLARSRSTTGAPLDRNAPGLRDARLHHWFGWDGGADSLWAFVIRPLGDPREIGASAAHLERVLATDPALACLSRAAAAPPGGDALRVAVSKWLAAYIETLDSPRTRFDDFRDALALGDADAARGFPADALRGLRRFVGDGRCSLCHLGPAFTNGEFHDIGRPFMAAPGRPDPGRHGGVRTVAADPFNRLGTWSDARDPSVAVRTRHLVPLHRNFGEFRVPGLRGALQTGPYTHDGSLDSLPAVIAHYSELPIDRLHTDGEALLRPLRLDPEAAADLAAFLGTLTGPAAPATAHPGTGPGNGARRPPPTAP